MKRLLLTCTDLMAIQFLVPHVKYLSEHGFSVELACSEVGGRLQELRTVLSGIAPVHTVRLVRNPFSLRNRNGLSDLKKITAFYESPVGKKLAESTPVMTAEAMEAGQQIGMGIAKEIMANLKEKGYVQ